MRSQGCTIQQALTQEAAAVVKQAVGLAKRRGHAQVTPLHVAHTMLSVSSGLFRAACLQAHAHPLQCRALELCFNVALNRLPTSTSGPMLGSHYPAQTPHPSLANALVAAFKRAQAHQRRGSIETQQQPLLAVKIELEQLIISILDDPSVSRVMREAGFSSTLVKTKVEQAVSVDLPAQNHTPNHCNNANNSTIKVKDSNDNIISCDNVLSSIAKPCLLMSNQRHTRVRNEDVVRVIESLVMKRRKRTSVVIGECIETLESLVKQVIERVEKSPDIPEELKEVKIVHLSFSSFAHLSREQVEQRVEDIKCLVKSSCMGNDHNKGLIFYLGDLKWANEFRVSNDYNNILVDQNGPIRRNYYCPIEHMIMEIGKMVLGYGESGKLWLLGIATFQTYMRCKSGQPSLETLWGLHAVTISADSLALSLILDSDVQSPVTNKKSEVSGSGWLMLADGGRGGGRFDDTGSRQSTPCTSETSNSTLPSWLQQYKDENAKRRCNMDNEQDAVPVEDLCKRWSAVGTSSMHITRTPTPSSSFDRSPSFSSISPSPSTSNFTYDPMNLQQPRQSFEPKNFFIDKPTLTMSIPERDDNKYPHQRQSNMFMSSNPNSTPTSTSSSDINESIDPSNGVDKLFKDYTADNLRALCNTLEHKVPRQKDIVFEIASTILHCRSGSSRRKVSNHARTNDEQSVIKEDTWLFFQGFDVEAKESIAREIAKLIFGSKNKFVSIGLSNFSSTTRLDSLEDSRNKRLRDEHSCAYIDRFSEAVSRDHHRVFFIEDIEQVDYCSQMGIKKAMERGKIFNHSNSEEISFGDAIIILSCESYSSKSRACSPSTKQKLDVSPKENHQLMKSDGKETDNTSPSVSLDLNISINDEDTNVVESQSIDEIGLLASVDRCIVFKNCPEL